MVAPILVALGLTAARWITVKAIIRAIAWASGLVLTGIFVKDVVSDISEAVAVETEADVISEIITDPDLSASQKEALVNKYLNELRGKCDTYDISCHLDKLAPGLDTKILLALVFLVVIIYMLSFTKR